MIRKVKNKLINNKKNIILLLLSLIIGVFIEVFKYDTEIFSFDRYFIFFPLIFFFLYYLFNDRKRINNFIYHKRYVIGILIFIYLVLNGYHGSSLTIYNGAIQGEKPIYSAKPIIGKERGIRGDEWIINSSGILSQVSNNFNLESKIITGIERNVNLFPKLPVKDISLLSSPNYLGFMFLSSEQAFSFYWYIGYFIMFFAVFELLMLVTNNNRLYSLLGSIIITFSPVAQWWESWNIIGYGSVAVLLFNKYLLQKKVFNKILLSLLIGIFGSCYIMCMYPAWQLPYGYFFLGIVIWLIIKNKENIKFKDFLLLLPIVITTIILIVGPSFVLSSDIYKLVTNTAYPGKRFVTGGENWQLLFNYFSSIFTPFFEFINPCEMSQFISLYPIPIILGIYYIIQNNREGKKDFLLVWLTLLAVLLTVWNYIELPAIISKLTFISMSTTSRCAVVASFVCTFLLILILANYSKIFKRSYGYDNLAISSLIVFLGVFVVKTMYPDYFTDKLVWFSILFYLSLIYMVLINSKKSSKYALLLMGFVSFITGAYVHPLNKGLDVIYDKPISKEINKIISEDNDTLWATISTPYYVQNYLVANGAPTLNATNYYPNFNLWDIIDKERVFEDIYNRYAHLTVNITNDNTFVEKMYEDHIILNINKKDICKLDLDYLVTQENKLEQYNNEVAQYKNIYNEYGMNIYKLNCK